MTRTQNQLDWLAQHERPVYFACILIGLIPLWGIEHFPSQDGPVHLYITYVMDRLGTDEALALGRVFEHNPYIEPNYLAYYLLLSLSFIVSLSVAHNLLVASYWISFCMSARYAVKSHTEGNNSIIAFLFLPFGFGYFLHMGFYNFSIGIVIFLALYGYAARNISQLRPHTLVVLGLGVLALAIAHLFALLMFLIALGALRVSRAVRESLDRPAERRAAMSALLIDAMKLSAVSLPALLIAASFVVRHMEPGSGPGVHFGLARLAAYIVTISPIHSLSIGSIAISLPYVVLVWSLILAALWRIARTRAVATRDLLAFAPAVVLLLLYFLVSVGLERFSAQERILPFVFFLLFFALAQMPLGPLARRTIVPALVLITVLSSLHRAGFYRAADNMLKEYVSIGSELRPGSTLLAIRNSVKGDRIEERSVGLRVNVMAHASALISIERDLVDLSMAFLSRNVFGYFPVVYKETSDPYAQIVASAPNPLIEFEKISGISIGYVLFWPDTAPSASLSPRRAAYVRNLARLVGERYAPVMAQGESRARLFQKPPVAEAIRTDTIRIGAVR